MIPFLLIAGGGYLLFDALGNSRKSFDPLDYGFPTKGYRGYRKGAAHFSDGGMTAGRWYRDKSGEEFKYIGKMDNGPDKGKLMFSDGKKHVYKTLEDFEGARPKESKLFGWFADGGTTSNPYEDFLLENGFEKSYEIKKDKFTEYRKGRWYCQINKKTKEIEVGLYSHNWSTADIKKYGGFRENSPFYQSDRYTISFQRFKKFLEDNVLWEGAKMADGGTTSKPIKVLKKFTDGDEYLTYRIVDEAKKIIEVDDFTKAILIEDGILTEKDFKKVINYFAFSYKNMSPEKLEKMEDLFEDNFR